ncbi:PBP1A family penicillin-binding protein [Heliobacterium undosum]|uniref:Penicillin-binding protein 1A n=1 Tax=Heliomicrobium undosum TaxID=121734 RepID=A0A845L2N1_9FIRM|nr:PBP1A family penicillin-binding protein [Heliomicrobium undosum]MZP30837.1 PBP1A family penicillin-binding protein [Heliomicrobium undosum]
MESENRQPNKKESLSPGTSQKGARKKIRWPRMILLIAAVLIVATIGIGSGLIFAWAFEAPSFSAGNFDVHTTSVLYDVNKQEFTKLHAGENRTLVENINDVPLQLRQAFLAIEDNKFYDHHGVDVIANIRAVIANITGGFGSQGASTITQQLVKLTFLTPEKTIKRKVQELVLSMQLERQYSKDEIFLMYLNRINFGEGAYGVKAAAKTFFGKELKDLKLSEAALLAGLPNAPSKWSPYKNPDGAEQRRQLILTQMAKYGYITNDEAEKAKKALPQLLDQPKRSVAGNDINLPYFTDAVIEECIDKYGITEDMLYKGGLRIYTTVDAKVQKAAEAALSDPNNYPKGKDNVPIQAAIAVVDHSNGEVRAIVGGREYTARRGLNRATSQMRQPGSVFKPIAVYGPALEKGRSPATVLDDVPTRYGSYEPGNYDGQFRGLINMREAIRLSVNIYAVKMLNEIGVQNGFAFARNLGITNMDEKNDMNLPLALGGLSKGTNPLELAGAYGAFANKGVWIEPHLIVKVEDRDGKALVEVKPKRQVAMKETTAYLMTHMLQTVISSGTGTNAQLDRPAGGKTGTTELPREIFGNITGNKDAWFAGITPELSGVVWMGYDKTDQNHYMYKTYGGSYPAQMWRSVMSKALQGVPVKGFERPPGIVEVNVDIKSGLLPSSLTPPDFVETELFEESTAPTQTSNVWVQVDINADTGLPTKPGDKASHIERKIFLKRPDGYDPNRPPADAELEAPAGAAPSGTTGTAPNSTTPGATNDAPALPAPPPSTTSPSGTNGTTHAPPAGGTGTAKSGTSTNGGNAKTTNGSAVPPTPSGVGGPQG